ncbi:hypothetical protein GGG16DRAFT_26882, partial [Schizophyllum commune]
DFKLKTVLSLSDLPTWDGTNIMDYLTAISMKTIMGKSLRVQLATALPQRWTGEAKQWFQSLPIEDQLKITRSLNALLRAMRKHYMTRDWINARTYEFDNMRFRQRGHELETPEQFFRRRYRYAIFLFPNDLDGSPAIGRLMLTAPRPWIPYLTGRIANVHTIRALLDRAYAEEAVLMSAWRDGLRTDRMLRAFNRVAEPGSTLRRPYYKEGQVARLEDEMVTIEEVSGEYDDVYAQMAAASPGEGHAEAYASTSKSAAKGGTPFRASAVPKECWPRGRTEKGYPFARDDSNVSRRQPKDGCYICTSPYHFAKDCRHYNQWKFLYQINCVDHVVALSVIQQSDEDWEGIMGELKENENSVAAYVADAEAVQPPAAKAEVRAESNAQRRARDPKFNAKKASRTPSPKTKGKGRAAEVETPLLPRAERRRSLRTIDDAVYTAQSQRERPEGFNSLGSRALRIQVCFNQLNSEPKEGRLDSGADITLLSEEELKSWENAPKPKQGMRMKLFHLTGHAKVLGYVRFKMFTLTVSGEFVQFTVEAYVVRGMKVPILLGEDFQ